MHFKLVFQALQVYYMKGIKEPSWSAIVDNKPRKLYEMSFPEEPYQEEEIKMWWYTCQSWEWWRWHAVNKECCGLYGSWLKMMTYYASVQCMHFTSLFDNMHEYLYKSVYDSIAVAIVFTIYELFYYWLLAFCNRVSKSS